MRIVCPSCSAEYEVPDARLRAGRAVRCARCGGTWTPEPASPAAPAAAPPAEQAPNSVERAGFDLETLPAVHDAFEPPPGTTPPEPPDEAPASRPVAPALRLEAPLVSRAPSPPRRTSVAGALVEWGASALALILLLWVAYAWRTPIMEAWPPSIRVYAALGIG